MCTNLHGHLCLHQLVIGNVMPEAICCCLQTCNVDIVLVVMYTPAFIVSSADISQLWVYLYYIA